MFCVFLPHRFFRSSLLVPRRLPTLPNEIPPESTPKRCFLLSFIHALFWGVRLASAQHFDSVWTGEAVANAYGVEHDRMRTKFPPPHKRSKEKRFRTRQTSIALELC